MKIDETHVITYQVTKSLSIEIHLIANKISHAILREDEVTILLNNEDEVNNLITNITDDLAGRGI